MADYRTEVRDGMHIDWDVPIAMTDGTQLRADVFRPVEERRYPVIMTHGPYAKGLQFQQGFPGMWKPLTNKHPEVLAGSSNKYQNWETVDPEKWVPDGYACVRVDSRGAGRSPGYLDIFSPQETRDYYECIEWAGTQPWSNGKVGLLGISYYAGNQWQVAALRPPHLAAICPWEGFSDYYREFTRHGGILNIFVSVWYPVQVSAVQHGGGGRGDKNPNTGEPIAGPEILSQDHLVANRHDAPAGLRARPLDGEYYRDRSGELEKITVPVLSAANWAHHLHTRGNFEGYARAGSASKWLEVHGLEHFAEFYTDYGLGVQRRFFGHFLKGEDTGWDRQPAVQLNARNVDGSFELRDEDEWPLARTEWTRMYLDLNGGTLSTQPADGTDGSSAAAFDAAGDGLTFTAEPFAEETEITGPAAARLLASSSTADADLFLTLRVLDPDGEDVTFVSGLDPEGVIGMGWLRASHRAVDPARSLPYRPWHPHAREEPLTPGQVVPLDIEIWPTSVIIPAGYRLAVTVQGRDFEFGGDRAWPAVYGVPMKGNGIFLHNDPGDRPSGTYAGTTTLISRPGEQPYLLLPFVPRDPGKATVRRGPYPRFRGRRALSPQNHPNRAMPAHPGRAETLTGNRVTDGSHRPEGTLMSLATLLDRNKAFAATDAVAKNPQIPWIPSQLSYIITCIDSRTEPAGFLGAGLGDATVQRTVGGRVTPAVLRDVAYISYLTETKTPDGPWWELAVIHHTDCGSTLLADPELRRGFAARGGFVEGELAWLPATDPAATVRADVRTLITAPQLSPNIMVSGYVYNTAAGTLDTVVEPTPAGKR